MLSLLRILLLSTFVSSIVCANEYLDNDGFPLVTFPYTTGSRTGFTYYFIPYVLLPEFERKPGQLLLTGLFEFPYNDFQYSGLFSNPSFTVKLDRVPDSVSDEEEARIFRDDINVKNTAILLFTVFTPKENGSYTFTLDYTGTSGFIAYQNVGADCPVVSSETLNSGNYESEISSVSDGPSYTSQLKLTVDMTAGQKYYVGYQYNNFYNDTTQITQAYASANFSVTLPNGDQLSDFTDYTITNLPHNMNCTFQNITTITQTWTEDYTTTFATSYPVSSTSDSDFQDGIRQEMIYDTVYYVNVPASASQASSSVVLTSSMELSSAVASLSSGISTSVSLVSSASSSSSSSLLLSSSSASESVPSSVVTSTSENPSSYPALTSSTGDIPSSSQLSDTTSGDISSSSGLTDSVSSYFFSSSSATLSGISESASSLYTGGDTALSSEMVTSRVSTSTITPTSSIPNRNVISTNSTQLSDTSVPSLQVSTIQTSHVSESDRLPQGSVTASLSSILSSERVFPSYTADRSHHTSQIVVVSRSSEAQFANNTGDSATSRHSGNGISYRTETVTNAEGVTITTTVPCEDTQHTISSATESNDETSSGTKNPEAVSYPSQTGSKNQPAKSATKIPSVHAQQSEQHTVTESRINSQASVQAVGNQDLSASRTSVVAMGNSRVTSEAIEQYTRVIAGSSQVSDDIPSAVAFLPNNDNGASRGTVGVLAVVFSVVCLCF